MSVQWGSPWLNQILFGSESKNKVKKSDISLYILEYWNECNQKHWKKIFCPLCQIYNYTTI